MVMMKQQQVLTGGCVILTSSPVLIFNSRSLIYSNYIEFNTQICWNHLQSEFVVDPFHSHVIILLLNIKVYLYIA